MRSKLPNTGTTIFTVMSRMAQEYGAINLSQGFPDFDCPQRLRELVSHYLNDRRNQYPPMTGIAQLREQIALKVLDHYGFAADMDLEVTVTSGATEALFDAIQASVTQGDEVIVFDPAYDSYEPAITLAGGRTIHLPLQLPDFSIDWDMVEQHLSPRTRLIIINTPHNPSGAVMSHEDMDTLAMLTRERDILVLSDEVYEHMVFDGGTHESVLRHPELRSRSFAVFSFGKTYHATGWKLAYCVAPPALTAEFRKVHQFVTFTSPSFIQYALADFMQECPEHARELPQFYQEKRDAFARLLQGSRFRFTPSRGTYFQLVDYGAISPLPDTEFANWLTQEVGVAAIPLSPFYDKAPQSTLIRFCFCKDDSTLQAATRLLRAL
ncbi:MAG: aminotransferase class I/II-fold pyridoxal phosphate-dependent enzyme [Pseudomonadales bacterium]|nr:aminotransferase class I/II-fold pyridoxal phosphate-dependent enzyme [Pseudomonadales bacterium]MCP5330290.1 aminotransferase class I/II-fold pyridoxal phosphate-dependent enzyme [Pseudomonadales bacterium]MCP5344094.1 aminotransferase class I/II-fold pyridoxal phosphate-dependent enzyme [Pseudomonadales bacterium]